MHGFLGLNVTLALSRIATNPLIRKKARMGGRLVPLPSLNEVEVLGHDYVSVNYEAVLLPGFF